MYENAERVRRLHGAVPRREVSLYSHSNRNLSKIFLEIKYIFGFQDLSSKTCILKIVNLF